MRRLLLVTASLLALPVSFTLGHESTRLPSAIKFAQDAFSPAQQRAIDEQIRDYILNHPEILPEAIKRLEERQVQASLNSARSELETPFPGAVGGNPKGDITLVVFFDYRCPYCHKAKKEEDELIAGDPNLRVVYRHFPALDRPDAPPISRHAALLALAAAQQGKHKAFHDALFAAPTPITEETLVQAVRTAGLDERKAAADSARPDFAAIIDHNFQLARDIGVTGTPTYVIGDHIVAGADRSDDLRLFITQQRAKARRG